MSSLQDFINSLKRPVTSGSSSSNESAAEVAEATPQQSALLPKAPPLLRKKAPLVYDASNYGYDLKIPLIDPRLTGAKTFTFSDSSTVFDTTAASFTPNSSGAVAYTPLIHSTDSLLSNIDTGLIYHEGDNTAFDQNYLIESDMTAAQHQIQLSFAVAMTVSSWSNATLALTGVTITLSSYINDQMPLSQPVSFTYSPENAFSALTAAGTHLFIVRDWIDVPLELRIHGPLIMNITINTSGSRGADTYQVGIVDMWAPVQTSANVARRMFPSEIISHIHPIPEHVEELNKFTDYELIGTGVKKDW